MKINIGSKNPTKVQAVTEALQESEFFKAAEIKALDVATEKFGHPITMGLVAGAMGISNQMSQVLIH